MPPQPTDYVDMANRHIFDGGTYHAASNGAPSPSLMGISTQEQDTHYWKRMFTELGFGNGLVDQFSGTSTAGFLPHQYDSGPAGSGAGGYNPSYHHLHFTPSYQ